MRRPRSLQALLVITVLASTASTLPAAAANDSDRAAVRTLTASAPCAPADGSTERGSVTIAMTYDPDERDSERVTVDVTDVAAGRRWRIDLAQYQGDQGVVLTTRRSSGDEGAWSFETEGFSGSSRVELTARNRFGERCEVGLTGRLSTLGSRPDRPKRILSSAPCSDGADVSLRLGTNPRPQGPDRIRAVVSDAQPRSRWEVALRVMAGDNGTVLLATRRADADGEWQLRSGGAGSEQAVDIVARTPGERCLVELSGRVADR